MSTTLQRQLAALAAPSSAVLVPERRRSSILFTSQEAAGYSRDKFYQIGLDGLYELIATSDKLFRKFRDSVLFDNESKNLERAVAEKQTNINIDVAVEQFLITVSPFLMLKAALKCLEWLVYRFHIEKFNVGSILKSIMPYYDTKTFVLIVQILEIDNYRMNKEWHWVAPSVKSALPLSKTTLYSNVNAHFIGWLFETLQTYLKVHTQENLRVYISFMTSTIVGVLNGISENMTKNSKKNGPGVIHRIWTELCSLLLKSKHEVALKSNEEVYCMVYVVSILLVLLSKEKPALTKPSESLTGKVMKYTLKTHPRSLKSQAYLILNAMAENSRKKLNLQNDARLYRILTDLSILSSEWDLWDLLSKIILNPVGLNQFYSSPNRIWKQLAKIELTVSQRSRILKAVYISLRNKPELPKKKWAKKFLTRFEREYPTEFAIASQADDKFAKDLAKQSNSEDIFLLSQHSEAEIRKESVEQLLRSFTIKHVRIGVVIPLSLTETTKKKKIKDKKTKLIAKKINKSVKQQVKKCKPDINSFAQALLPRFNDDDVRVVRVLVKQKPRVLCKLFKLETVVEQFVQVIQRRLTTACTKAALQKLIKLASRIPVSNVELKSKVFVALFPFLFPTEENSVLLTKAILSSKCAKKDPVFKQYTKVSEMQARDLSDFSYELFSKKGCSYTLWNKKLRNASQAVLACLASSTENDFEHLMAAADLVKDNLQFECKASPGGYPITKDNFSKCMVLAEKYNALSLDLVLRTILEMKLTNFPSLARVMTFVMRSSLNVENRNVCVKFLQQFLTTTLTSLEAQLNFWCYMIRCCKNESKNEVQKPEELEFFLIRSLQFLTSFFDSILKSEKNKLKIGYYQSGNAYDANNNCTVELILTQCLLVDSHRVRLAGLNCLQAAVRTETTESEMTSFLNYLLAYREEILADKSQVSIVISEAFRQNRFPNVMNHFVEIVLQTKDRAIAVGLLQLNKFASSQIFQRFIPLVKELLVKDPHSEILMAVLDCFDGSLDGTWDVITGCLKTKLTCSKILSKFTQDVVEKFDFNMKRKLFANLIDSVLHCETPDIKVAVQRCVRKWILEGSIIAAELDKCIVMEKLQGCSAQTGRSLALRKKEKVKLNIGSGKSCFGNVNWTDRAEVTLEFLQPDKKMKLKTKLILPLFKLLKMCITLEEQTPVEYLKQLILTSMTLCCYQDEKIETQDSNDWIHFNVETIIDCLRCSRNPQTHHHALILLNYAARRYPEQVLHGIMSLFTFMGSSILRQDDAYSTQLIQQTVTTIIPTLAITGAVGKFSKGLVSAGIFRVFTSAVQDIPIHRRLPVFTSLVETLQPSESLWQVCIIIVDNALTRDKKRSNLNADIDLATDLVWNFEAEVVLMTIEKIYTYLIELNIYDDCSNDAFQKKSSQIGLSRAVMDLSRKESLRDVEIVILFTLELISKICVKFSDLDNQKLTYDFVLEKCLSYSRTVGRIREDKIFRLITQRNFEVIGKINAILEPKDFVRVTKSILDRDDMNVKKKMIDMLNHRIIQKAEWFRDIEVLMELLPPLVELGSSTPETEEMVTVVQMAFLSLKLIARQLAATHPEDFISVFELCLTHCSNKNRLLGASALLCMSELFCLKSLILTNLDSMCSTILKAFKASAKLNSKGMQEHLGGMFDEKSSATTTTTANLLCVSTMTCANKLTEQMGPFLGAKFLQKLLVIALSTDGIFGVGEKADNRKKVFDLKLKSLMKTVATKIPLRISLPSMVKVFKDLVEIQDNRTSGIIILMGALKEALQTTEKGDFTPLLPALCDAFLEEFLTYRERVNIEKPDNEILPPENAVIDCLISGIVLKMSEGVFRPFYHRCLDWASDSLPRLIAFYRVSAAAAERLKSLFVTFAGYVITKTPDSLKIDATLTQAILKYFYQIFLNDREGFITIDRFNSLVTPILDLVESDYVISETIDIKEVNEVLIQLAVATNDLNRWQYLIELISMKSQHPNRKVRLFVLSTLEAAGNELGKDFLPLLPPAVPFLAELLTDDDRHVENETRKVLLKLEDIIGEPLQPYFMT